jgi:hypothetical protein
MRDGFARGEPDPFETLRDPLLRRGLREPVEVFRRCVEALGEQVIRLKDAAGVALRFGVPRSERDLARERLVERKLIQRCAHEPVPPRHAPLRFNFLGLVDTDETNFRLEDDWGCPLPGVGVLNRREPDLPDV